MVPVGHILCVLVLVHTTSCSRKYKTSIGLTITRTGDVDGCGSLQCYAVENGTSEVCCKNSVLNHTAQLRRNNGHN